MAKVKSPVQNIALIEEAITELVWARSIFQNEAAFLKYLERAEQKIKEVKKNLMGGAFNGQNNNI